MQIFVCCEAACAALTPVRTAILGHRTSQTTGPPAGRRPGPGRWTAPELVELDQLSSSSPSLDMVQGCLCCIFLSDLLCSLLSPKP